MRILGIETSCDETGIGIYDSEQGLLAHALYTQTDIHAPFGGVVPELASRDHLKKIIPLIKQALHAAQLDAKQLDGIAYTRGPGLIGALLTGAVLGRTLGFAWNIPTIGVHHLEGHLLAAFLEPRPPCFPFLGLLVSGGHTELIWANARGDYQVLGETLDDAAGEAFDKTAKLLGLGYPGGAALAKLAEQGRPGHFHFPRPMTNRPGLDFSFSGLKTFAWHTLQEAKQDDPQTKADIAFAFQEAVAESIAIKCRRAILQTGAKRLVVAGGVGANLALRQALQEVCSTRHVDLYFPRIEFCTDNGAMIAYAGCQRLLAGEQDGLEIDVLARWPLESLSRSLLNKG